MNAKGGKDIMDPPWLAKDALEMDTIPLSKKEVSSDVCIGLIKEVFTSRNSWSFLVLFKERFKICFLKV
jgi:hypothetical protein